MIGCDPRPFTLRELCLMSLGKAKEKWSHTSAIITTIVNVNRDPKKAALPFDTFNPFNERVAPGAIEVTDETLPEFRKMFKPK